MEVKGYKKLALARQDAIGNLIQARKDTKNPRVAKRIRRQVARLCAVATRDFQKIQRLAPDYRRVTNARKAAARRKKITDKRQRLATERATVERFNKGEFKPTFE